MPPKDFLKKLKGLSPSHEEKDKQEMARTRKRWEEDEIDAAEFRAQNDYKPRLRTGLSNARGHRIFQIRKPSNYRKDIELK